ncbi:hypothetical protein OBBRIDRAFT_517683 [Obba rivulosa]|uniref:Uncharacterized protein n=1 Tax=Obba rivulosa TaxID=1052685 RepID=A0A8E2DMW8_9APHY|nr:hypothetical protein OBBRIDRAFT_517683 [Obba rivulosa]
MIFLPHLRALEWCQPLISTTFLLRFASQGLDKIKINLPGPEAYGVRFPREHDPNIVYLIEDISTQSPYLREISLIGQFNGLSLRSLGKFRALRRLTIAITPVALVSLQAVQDISGMETLENLRISLPNLPHGRFGALRPGFPSLKVLNLKFIGGHCHCQVDSILSAVESPHMTELSVIWEHGYRTHITCRPSLQVIPARWSSTMTRFSMSSAQPYNMAVGHDHIADVYADMKDVLGPLLPLRHLQHLYIEFMQNMKTNTFSLHSEDMKTMAEAWPELEDLHLRMYDSLEEDDPHGPSISSLVHFTRHCPRLRGLRIPAVYVDSKELACEGFPTTNHGLITLHAHSIRPKGEEDGPSSLPALALFLTKLFPNMQEEPEYRRAQCVCDWEGVELEMRRLRDNQDNCIA